MSYECQFFSNRFSVNVNFRVLLKGLNGSSKADFLSFCRSRHDTEESFAAQPLLLSFHGTLPTDFLGPRYIFPWIFPIPCLALIRSKITKLPAGTSGRLSAILPLCSVGFFKKLTTDDRSDDNVFKSLDQPLVFKSILQILQKSLGTMLVPFSGVFIPGLLCCKLHAWPRSTRSTRSNDILSLFTTQVEMGCWYHQFLRVYPRSGFSLSAPRRFATRCRHFAARSLFREQNFQEKLLGPGYRFALLYLLVWYTIISAIVHQF